MNTQNKNKINLKKMPNHITNTLEASREVIKFLLNNKGEVDFNNVIPMPKDIDPQKPVSLGNRTVNQDLVDKYGFDNWYDWSINNWDTKWNAYNTDEVDEGITFLTAWSPPTKVLIALSKKFPEETIINIWDDEGDDLIYQDLYENGCLLRQNIGNKIYEDE